MDVCLQAFLNDPETRKKEKLFQWIGQYRAVQNGIPAPMDVLTIEKEHKPIETYWKPVLEKGAQFIAIWGDRVLYSRIKNDATGLGFAQAGDNPAEIMDVYEINPVWWMLCLDAKPGARYLGNPHGIFPTGTPGKGDKLWEGFTSATEEQTNELQQKVEQLRQELIASNSDEAETLGGNLAKFNTLASERGEETRQALLDAEQQLNAKNRYLEVIHEESVDWEIFIRALVAFFFLVAMCVFPVTAYYTNTINAAQFFGIIFFLIFLYVIYVIYMYRQRKVRDFIEPQYLQVQQGLQNVSEFLKKQVDEANNSLAQYVNDNCSCPPGTDMASATSEITGQTAQGRTGTAEKVYSNYLPQGQVFSERGAPHQMVAPNAKPPSSFTIEWDDIWMRANQLPLKVDETYGLYQTLGLPKESSIASEQLNRVVQTAKFINGFAKGNVERVIAPVEYVYFVMLFIYRDKHIVTERELADMTTWFLAQNFGDASAAGCGLVRHIMQTGEFKLTFGSPSQWFTYACSHPFYPGAQLQRQTLAKNL